MEHTVANFAADNFEATPESLPLYSAYNLITRTYYDDAGRQIAVVRNYSDNDSTLTESEIAGGLPTYNHVTRTYYDDLGRVEHTVANFVGDIVNSSAPPAYVPGTSRPDRNLVARYYYDGLGRLSTACSDWNGSACSGPVKGFFYEYYGASNLPQLSSRTRAASRVSWTGCELA